MKILYDNQIFKMQKFGGISRYYAELLRGISNEPEFESIPAKYFSDNRHLRLNGLTYLNNFKDNYRFRGKFRIEKYINNRENNEITKILKEGKFDLFHPTYYDPSLIQFLPLKKPFVLTVYDMIHEMYYDEHFEEVHPETKHKRDLIPKANHIIAISQSTKNDILKFFPEVDEKKITVIYLGSSFSSENVGTGANSPLIYILFVGKRGFYKNFTWLLKSVSRFLKQNNISLICAGGGDFTDYEKMVIENAGVSDKVRYVNINNDNDLASVYKGAACFIFPSLYEGFGIPVLEAFSCSCPVILPDASCFPEIAGDAALYFEQGNSESITEQLNKVLKDPDMSNDLRNKGAKRLKLFNWDKTVSNHIQLYKEVCANN